MTKGFPAAAISAAVVAGCRRIGENYAQELGAKLDEVEPSERPIVHFIGRLQSNKVARLAGNVDVWESVDRPSLLDAIARHRPGATVLLQVNATGEAGKGGCPPVEVEGLARRALDLNLDLNGLMTVGPTDGEATLARRAFSLVRALTTELDLTTCSMGMSADLDLAVDLGSTRVRLGTALFGPRQ